LGVKLYEMRDMGATAASQVRTSSRLLTDLCLTRVLTDLYLTLYSVSVVNK